MQAGCGRQEGGLHPQGRRKLGELSVAVGAELPAPCSQEQSDGEVKEAELPAPCSQELLGWGGEGGRGFNSFHALQLWKDTRQANVSCDDHFPLLDSARGGRGGDTTRSSHMCCEGAGGAKACQESLGCESPAGCSPVNKSGCACPWLCCPRRVLGARCPPRVCQPWGHRGLPLPSAASGNHFRNHGPTMCFLPRWMAVTPRGSWGRASLC